VFLDNADDIIDESTLVFTSFHRSRYAAGGFRTSEGGNLSVATNNLVSPGISVLHNLCDRIAAHCVFILRGPRKRYAANQSPRSAT
jgi:hypothetical protein